MRKCRTTERVDAILKWLDLPVAAAAHFSRALLQRHVTMRATPMGRIPWRPKLLCSPLIKE